MQIASRFSSTSHIATVTSTSTFSASLGPAKQRRQSHQHLSTYYNAPAAAAAPALLSSRRVSPSSVGRRVLVSGAKSGVLRFYGRTHFGEGGGVWCGVELDERGAGRHGGTVEGVTYFECEGDRGLFAPLYKVTLLPEEEPEDSQPRLKRESTFTIDDEDRRELANGAVVNGAAEVTDGEGGMERNARGARGARPPPPPAQKKKQAAPTTKRRSVAAALPGAASKQDSTFTVPSSAAAEKSLNRTFQVGGGGAPAKRAAAPRPVPATSAKTEVDEEDNESLEILSPVDMR